MYDLLAFCLIGAGALGIASVAGRKHLWGLSANLLALGVALRIVGSLSRHEVLFRFYRGFGDAVLYYNKGLELARGIWSLELLPFSLDYWAPNAHWWGTPFLDRLSGLALALIGPSLRGEFLVFALVSLVGMLLLAQAQAQSQPDADGRRRFALWLLVWPSMWYWPSSVGKEAVLLLAIGLTVAGYVGREGRIRWVMLLSGVGLAFAVRPHVAATLSMAALAAHWLESWRRFGVRQVLEAIAAVVLMFVAFGGMRAQFGLEDADLEGVLEFVEYRAGQTMEGGSNIGSVPVGPQGVPLAVINVWMRPFPWEVHNLTSAIASGELVFFWFMAWQRRKAVMLALRRWREHRLLRFALPMLVVYTIMIGMTFGNLGIIARQRVLVFPFMLLILTAAPSRLRTAAASGAAPVTSERRAA